MNKIFGMNASLTYSLQFQNVDGKYPPFRQITAIAIYAKTAVKNGCVQISTSYQTKFWSWKLVPNLLDPDAVYISTQIFGLLLQ